MGEPRRRSWNPLRPIPGIVLLVALGVIAVVLAGAVREVNAMIVAVILGVGVSNVLWIPEWAESGIEKHDLVLETGIVLMGVRVTFGSLVDVGPQIVLLIATVLLMTTLLVEMLSRRLFNLPEKLGSLLAVGSSICGVSAIVAVAGSIRANGTQITYAVATILLFDAVTLALYPVIGQLLNLSDTVFGIWAGVSMFSTGPATAAGFIYSDTAGRWAALTKVTRNAFIGVAAISYAVYYNTPTENSQRSVRMMWEKLPKFVIGFFIVMALANLGLLTQTQIGNIETLFKWLFVVAFAGLGLDIKIADMRSTGLMPVLTVLLSLAFISSLSLGIILLVF